MSRGEHRRGRGRAVASLSGGLGALVIGILVWGTSADQSGAVHSSGTRDNVVLIMVDDLRYSDLKHMTKTNDLLVKQGTTFKNFTITMPTCCPSRASFLRGQYAHNHKVGHGNPATEEFFRKGQPRLEDITVATLADDAGYRTGLVGKYLNGYGQNDTNNTPDTSDDTPAPLRPPPGWDYWRANWKKDVWATLQNQNGSIGELNGYLDARLGEAGVHFIGGGNPQTPFFLWQNFNAPHRKDNEPPQPERPEDLLKFEGVPSPRNPDFDYVNASMPPHDTARLEWPLTQQQKQDINVEHRHRLASLQAVDRQVEALVNALAASGDLANTYIFFTTDNGYHLGERRLEGGKLTPLLTDHRVPLVVRGPRVRPNVEQEEFVQNTDFLPTVAAIAGAETPGFIDGRSIVSLLENQSVPGWRTATYFEGRPLERPSDAGDSYDPTKQPSRFAGLITGDGYNYVEYADGSDGSDRLGASGRFKELYYLVDDPFQRINLAGESNQTHRVSQLSDRLQRLRTCARQQCRNAENGP